jgi:hypothetical protein
MPILKRPAPALTPNSNKIEHLRKCILDYTAKIDGWLAIINQELIGRQVTNEQGHDIVIDRVWVSVGGELRYGGKNLTTGSACGGYPLTGIRKIAVKLVRRRP